MNLRLTSSYLLHLNPDGQPKWGYLDQCPYCPASNIVKMAPNQTTCAGEGCSEKANKAATVKRREKAKAKAARAVVPVDGGAL